MTYCKFRDSLRYVLASVWHRRTAVAAPHQLISKTQLKLVSVLWIQKLLDRSTPVKPWEETPGQLAARLRAAVAFVNENYKVKELCLGFPSRLTRLCTTPWATVYRGRRLRGFPPERFNVLFLVLVFLCCHAVAKKKQLRCGAQLLS